MSGKANQPPADKTVLENKALLCLETSTSAGSVALVDSNGLLARCGRNSRAPHTQDLFLKVKQLLDDFALQPADLFGVAVASGPGSFTGLRVAVSAAKTLAWTAGVPLYSVCSLEALAFGAAAWKLPVCAIFNAGQDELYAAVYSWPEPDSRSQEILAPAAFSLQKLCAKLAGIERVICIGEGFCSREKELTAFLGAGLAKLPSRYNLPDAALVGETVLKGPELYLVKDIFGFEPFYVRSGRAQLRLKR